ncbi:MAG TPA: alcohol dehydrogenase catalytic domain-containing protein [Acidimicrobiales bacterium]|nr:alcohol dehydrogenase catalytic domain-containing protein [Acidimicrobiales bacterium]
MYQGPRQVAVEQRPDPTVADPQDAIVRITTTNICGSDLHMYEGRTNVEEGKILGHENMGVVEAVGPAVQWTAAGRRLRARLHHALRRLPDRLARGGAGGLARR